MKTNFAVFKDNEPKYKIGDLVLYEYPRLAGIIEDIKKKALTEEDKKEISESVARLRNCCGNKGKGILYDNFTYKYKVNGSMIYEKDIVGVGIDAINEHLQKQYDDYAKLNKRISNAASELGYNDDW